LDFQGNFVRIVGVGQFKYPYHLFVDSDDNILVADNENNSIQVFHQNGDHMKTIGTGQLSNPLGVCMDHEGRIIVSESGANRISIFHPPFVIVGNLKSNQFLLYFIFCV